MDSGDYLLQAMEEMIPTLKASPIAAHRDVGLIFEVLLERVREKAWAEEAERSAQIEEARRNETRPPF